MLRRVLCPRHKEETPSCVVYAEHAFCFGCQQSIPLSEVGLSPEDAPEAAEPENIQDKIDEITKLPIANIRGFPLHTDGDGYYLVWPNYVYYKYRRFGEGPKYIGPKGHTPPVFEAGFRYTGGTCFVVEGEFNALSITKVAPNFRVLSPGGAGQFYSSKTGRELLTMLKDYDRIIIVADNDAAGAKAAIELKAKCLAQGKWKTSIHLWDIDANDLLVKYGQERLAEEVRKCL